MHNENKRFWNQIERQREIDGIEVGNTKQSLQGARCGHDAERLIYHAMHMPKARKAA